MTRILLIASLLAAFAVVIQSASIKCDPKPGDERLFEEKVSKKSDPHRPITIHEIVYPKDDALIAISCVRVLDSRLDGNGGEAKIVSGGIDKSFVIINMQSKANFDLGFIVEIFGKVIKPASQTKPSTV